MINRHIRHDWQTFVDWDQKSVRSVCGVTTKRHLAGIPGITIQNVTEPDKRGNLKYGWCVRCCVSAGRTAARSLSISTDGGTHLVPSIRKLYVNTLTEINSILTLWTKYKRNLPPADLDLH